MKLISALAGAAIALLAATSAQTADFPNGPVTMVVPYPAGGSSDVIARIVADGMSKALGQQVLVDNKPGGATVIGTMAVIQAPPDGQTILYAGPAVITTPHLAKDPQFNANTQLKPVSLLQKGSVIFVVKADHKAQNLKDLIDEAKADPGSMNVGVPGLNSGNHLALESFVREVGIDVEIVPFQGNAPQLTALAGGVISVAIDTGLTSSALMKAGTIRGIAVSSKERTPQLPDVPTVAEQGYPDWTYVTWNAIYAPAATPDDVVAKLNAAIDQTLQDPEVKQRIYDLHYEVVGGPVSVIADFAAEEEAYWSKFIADNDLRSKE